MKFTSLLEEVHFNMIRRLLFSSILAAQFLAFSPVGRVDASRCPDLSSGGPSGCENCNSRAGSSENDCENDEGASVGGIVRDKLIHYDRVHTCRSFRYSG